VTNTVVLLACLLRNARFVFLDVIYSISIFKINQKSDCYWELAQVYTAPMLSKSNKILMNLNSKQKTLFQLATMELFPKETKKRETLAKWQKRVWVWCLRSGVTNMVPVGTTSPTKITLVARLPVLKIALRWWVSSH